MTNSETYGLYKNYLKEENIYSKDTEQKYLFYIDKFVSELDNRDIAIEEVTYGMALDIMKSFYNTGATASVFNAMVSSVNSLYKVLMNTSEYADIIDYNPTKKIMKKSSNKEQKVPLTKEEQEMMIANCKNSRDKAIFILFIETGLRVHELTALTLEQYQNRTENNIVNLTVTKGSYAGHLYFSDRSIEAIEEYLLNRKECGCDKLFVSNSGKEMCSRSLSKTWKCIAKKCGIENHMCNHLLRATKATDMHNNGATLEDIKTILRHKSVSTTELYVKSTEENFLRVSKAY